MLKGTTTLNNGHKRFIERVIETETVWYFELDDGILHFEANDYEDTHVLPVFSDETLAMRFKKENEQDLEMFDIPLFEFLYEWLILLQEDDVVIGMNWREHEYGSEMEGNDLFDQIVDAMPEKMRTNYWNTALERLKKAA